MISAAPQLAGRIAVVTGAASGIGEACARKLFALGSTLVLSDVNEDRGNSIVQDLKSKAEPDNKADALFMKVDMSKGDQTKEFSDKVLEKFGASHAIILGRVINIGSIHSLVASPGKIAYVTLKHGLVGMTKAIAVEGGKYGVTANCICPSYVRTPLVEKQIVDQAKLRGISEAEVIERIMLPDNAVIKRLLEPSEVAEFCAFLCSDAAQCITGSEHRIDCGWTSQ
ncbi:hypothetical protein INT43_003120 [Umbelopsis isabellina]|uniref:3-oxoacyl-[acyl-carrier-protein] reductase n=1 Tax=Mortierella isabellina TaxID=91625 RepID=A0A8H7PPN7_MORIS|nr:hypothetical protein INT43_003120 [Umbelopsis isabellina]